MLTESGPAATATAVPDKPTYKGGVLIIGSLYWDLDRENWRNANLVPDKNSWIAVKAPIRYGRISSSRKNTYSMIFSKECDTEQLRGVAKFAPFHGPVTIDGLHQQSVVLINAEKNESKGSYTNYHWSWGSLGLKLNPKLSADSVKNITDSWKAKFNAGELKKDEYKLGQESSMLDDTGMLNMEWPKELDAYDFFIATATKPKIETYPGPVEIAGLMIKKGYQDYFQKNKESGITTASDNEIDRHMQQPTGSSAKGNIPSNKQNIQLVIYSLIIGSVLGSFIYDLFRIIADTILEDSSPLWHSHRGLVICKGIMFVSALFFYGCDYVNTTIVMEWKRTKLVIDIIILVLTGLTFKALYLNGAEPPVLWYINISYLLFLGYYIFLNKNPGLQGKKKAFYKKLKNAETLFFILFLPLAFAAIGKTNVIDRWLDSYMDVDASQWITAGLMLASSVTFFLFVRERTRKGV